MLHHPWIGQLPRILVHTRDVDVQRVVSASFLQDATRVELAEAVGAARRAAVLPAAELAKTEWMLSLDPTAVAISKAEWPRADWFRERENELPPVCVAARWGYVKPADLLTKLDTWGDSHDSLRGFTKLDLPVAADSDRIEHLGISSWCLFARTAFVKSVREITGPNPPEADESTLLWYVATRLHKPIVRVQMKDFGWDHSFGRSEEAVIAAAMHATRDEAEKPAAALGALEHA